MKKTNETGRSMVELLGVLMIIGVLSIGSLAGYDYTRRQARVTSTVETVSKLLAVSRVKGRAVTSFSEKMDATVIKDKVAVWANARGEVWDVNICGCTGKDSDWGEMKKRIYQSLTADYTKTPSDVGPRDGNFTARMNCRGGGLSCITIHSDASDD